MVSALGCGPDVDPNPYCEPQKKAVAPLAEFLLGDWECETWQIDSVGTQICSFSSDGLYHWSRIEDCEVSGRGDWFEWSVDADNNVVIGPASYAAFVSASEIVLEEPSGEVIITLRAQDCVDNCRSAHPPPR